jgi:hypothetical protein
VKLSQPARLLREALTDVPAGDYVDRILEKINSDSEQTNNALMQNLTIADNMNAAIVPYAFTHATEKKIPNPLKTRPVGVYPIRAMAINGGTRYAIESYDWRFVDSGDPKQPQQIGVTIDYKLDHAKPCLIRMASAVQLIPRGIVTALTGWNVTEFSRGSEISDDGSIFTVSEAGTYLISANLAFEAATYTGGYLVIRTPGSIDIAEDFRVYTSADRPIINAAGTVKLAAGGTFTAFGYHTNAALVDRNVTTERRISVHRLYNDTVPQNTVSLLVIGG